MRKDSVLVNGVILTREVLEKAIQELNPPIVQRFTYPCKVRLKTLPSAHFVVPSEPVRRGVDASETLWGSSNQAAREQQTLICANSAGGYSIGGAYRLTLSSLEVVL